MGETVLWVKYARINKISLWFAGKDFAFEVVNSSLPLRKKGDLLCSPFPRLCFPLDRWEWAFSNCEISERKGVTLGQLISVKIWMSNPQATICHTSILNPTHP